MMPLRQHGFIAKTVPTATSRTSRMYIAPLALPASIASLEPIAFVKPSQFFALLALLAYLSHLASLASLAFLARLARLALHC